MALWSCPHCGAVQAAASRCWVCHRSSTTCSTCRHFRTSLSAEVGWCALDRRRRPLTGLELRGCWSERPAGAAPPDGAGPRPGISDPRWRELPGRGFVPVESPVAPPVKPRPMASAPELPLPDLALAAAEPPDAWDSKVSLFGDLDR